jgi:hypothetical protein
VGLKTATEPQSGCTIDGNLTGNVFEMLRWLFPQEKATLHALRYWKKVRMRMGMNQSMFVFLSEGAAGF